MIETNLSRNQDIYNPFDINKNNNNPFNDFKQECLILTFAAKQIKNKLKKVS